MQRNMFSQQGTVINVLHLSFIFLALFILILIAVLLWKKIQAMDWEMEDREWERESRRGGRVDYERTRVRGRR